LTTLAAASLVTGCLSTGVRDRDRDRDSDREEEDARPREVQGTVEHIDPVNHRIDVAQGERADRGDLGRRDERRGNLAIYYDPDTVLEHADRHFRPQDLRRGDSIRAEVEPTAAGLIVQRIEVLSGEPGGLPPEVAPEVPPAPETREAPEYREAPPPREVPEYREDARRDPLRGIVRYVDLSAHTVEIETPPSDNRRSGRVRVEYDADTAVEFQGRHFSPEDLQLGDRVEVDLRQHGGPPLARQIVIVSGEPTERH